VLELIFQQPLLQNHIAPICTEAQEIAETLGRSSDSDSEIEDNSDEGGDETTNPFNCFEKNV